MEIVAIIYCVIMGLIICVGLAFLINRIIIRQKDVKNVSSNLDSLQNANVPISQKKDALMSLIDVGYILIHLLVNSEGDYNIYDQKNKYCKFISAKHIDALNEIEEKLS